MSKKKKKSKKSYVPKTTEKDDYRPLIIFIVAIICIVASVFIFNYISKPPADISGTKWKSVSAYDASKDEVDMSVIYENYYSSYQGSLELNEDNTFAFWLQKGNPTDGTHSGKYEYDKSKDIINATFDNGEEKEFKIVRDKNNKIKRIEAPYEKYTVYFELK